MATRERLRTALSLFRSPAAPWLAIRMLGWSIILPGLKYVLPFPRLVKVMWSAPRGGRQQEREQLIVFLAQRIYRLRPFLRRDNCLERSLLTYRYLSAAGADPSLVVGVKKSDNDFAGHAWVLVDDFPLFENHSTLDSYVELTEFAGPRPPELS